MSRRARQESPPADYPVVDPVTDYEKIKRIGEGTYGVVYKARDRRTGQVVALKQVLMGREADGMPVTSIRELRVLQSCRHANLVELKRVVTGSKMDSIFLVFEYCEHDMGRLLDSMPQPFTEAAVKCLMLQLLRAVAHLHKAWIMHRDLKMSNLLLTNAGELKLCDFGLARYFRANDDPCTPKVITLWYRAPEVLLGSAQYTEAVDMWSVGCIFGELLRHEPLFPGQSEVAMASLITKLLGSPSERIWPGFEQLPAARQLKLPDQPYNQVDKEFPRLSLAGIDLLNRMLTYDPEKRISAESALRHDYFRQLPLPLAPDAMPAFPSAHDLVPSSRHTRRAQLDDAEHARGIKRQRKAIRGI